MCSQRFVQTVVVMVVLFVCPGFVRAKAYRLTVVGEAMESVAQPERGYVVKVAERAGGFCSLAGRFGLNTEDATRVGGRDRRGRSSRVGWR